MDRPARAASSADLNSCSGAGEYSVTLGPLLPQRNSTARDPPFLPERPGVE